MQYTIQEYKLKRNTVTIYAYHDKTVKKSVKFRDIKGKIIEGYFNFANRITSGNGFLVHDQQGFNSKGGAKKNLQSLKRICALMQ